MPNHQGVSHAGWRGWRPVRRRVWRLGWLLVVGTVPAGRLGLLFQDSLRSVFASAQSAAFFLILNGFMLYGAERLRRRAPVHDTGEGSDARIAEQTSWIGTLAVGAAQALALVPGFSRSGASMGGGLLIGLILGFLIRGGALFGWKRRSFWMANRYAAWPATVTPAPGTTAIWSGPIRTSCA